MMGLPCQNDEGSQNLQNWGTVEKRNICYLSEKHGLLTMNHAIFKIN